MFPLSRALAASVSLSALVLASFAFPGTAKAEDPVGSWAGLSYGINRSDDDFAQVATEVAISITDNIQIRGTLGGGYYTAIPTYSFSAGNWRFAGGAGIEYVEDSFIETIQVPNKRDADGNAIVSAGFRDESETTGSDGVNFVGLLAAERAFGRRVVIFGSTTFSEEVRGSVGAGFRF